MNNPTLTITLSLVDAIALVDALQEKVESARNSYKTYQPDRLEKNWYGKYADEADTNFVKYSRILSELGIAVDPLEFIQPNEVIEPEPEPEGKEIKL